MVSKAPPVGLMSKDTREQYESLPQEVEEDAPQSEGVACSADDLRPAADGFRYIEVPILGIEKPVRFRSLTARHFEEVAQEEDRNILLYSVCDSQGRLYLDNASLQALIDSYDARTYAHLLAVANHHCLAGADLATMTEEAEKNLPASSLASAV